MELPVQLLQGSIPLQTQLRIENLSYFVCLGCGEAERSLPQEVQISVSLDFPQMPKAFEDDKLENTVCYAQTEKILAEVCQSRSFHTVEKLSHLCWQSVQVLCPKGTQLSVQVHKLRPPLARKNTGAFCVVKGVV